MYLLYDEFAYSLYNDCKTRLYHVDTLDNVLFYFLGLQYAVVVFLATFSLFRLCKLSYTLDKVLNISHKFFSSWCLLYHLKLRCVTRGVPGIRLGGRGRLICIHIFLYIYIYIYFFLYKAEA